jgi:hypothetical protein
MHWVPPTCVESAFSHPSSWILCGLVLGMMLFGGGPFGPGLLFTPKPPSPPPPWPPPPPLPPPLPVMETRDEMANDPTMVCVEWQAVHLKVRRCESSCT